LYIVIIGVGAHLCHLFPPEEEDEMILQKGMTMMTMGLFSIKENIYSLSTRLCRVCVR
jgi:hypothetical protein